MSTGIYRGGKCIGPRDNWSQKIFGVARKYFGRGDYHSLAGSLLFMWQIRDTYTDTSATQLNHMPWQFIDLCFMHKCIVLWSLTEFETGIKER